MSRSPELSEVLNTLLEGALDDLHVSLPGKVVRYDGSKQEADVQPLIKVWHEDEAGERVVAQLPVVTGVPVVFPGGGGFLVQFPVSVGDTVLLVFSAVSLDKWLATGGGPVDPEGGGAHSLADAVAIPGLRDFKHARSQAPSGHILVGKDGAPSEKVGLGETIKAHFDALKTWLEAHTHSVPIVGPAGTTPTTPPLVLPSPLVPETGSGTVKVTK